MQCHATVPEVVTYSAAIRACEKGQQHQQALRLLRVMQCLAIVSNVIVYSAAICGQQHQQTFWVDTCLPARTRLAPGRGRAASCRFADIGRL